MNNLKKTLNQSNRDNRFEHWEKIWSSSSSSWGSYYHRWLQRVYGFLIPKGSVSIDGISLTVVDVLDDSFTCHLIPHTLKETVLHLKTKGDTVNLEFDMIGKYLYRFHQLSL